APPHPHPLSLHDALPILPAQIIRNDRVRYAVRPELEGRERRALVARAGFIDPYVHGYPGVMRHVDRRKCSAPINAGKPTGVTVRDRKSTRLNSSHSQNSY